MRTVPFTFILSEIQKLKNNEMILTRRKFFSIIIFAGLIFFALLNWKFWTVEEEKIYGNYLNRIVIVKLIENK